jgi:hypothetical protein
MFMSCDRFKSDSGKSFAGQSVTLARLAFEHARHMRRPHSVSAASSGRRWATAKARILSIRRAHDYPSVIRPAATLPSANRILTSAAREPAGKVCFLRKQRTRNAQLEPFC